MDWEKIHQKGSEHTDAAPEQPKKEDAPKIATNPSTRLVWSISHNDLSYVLPSLTAPLDQRMAVITKARVLERDAATAVMDQLIRLGSADSGGYVQGEPISSIYYPILNEFPSRTNPAPRAFWPPSCTGACILATFLPDDVQEPVLVVIHNIVNQTFTYEVRGQVATF